jgi:hypothetical protein
VGVSKTSAMTPRAVWVLIAALTLTAACATTNELPITEFNQVAGAWATSGRSAVRGRVIIQTNGKYWMTLGSDAALQGQLSIEGGALRYDLGPGGSRRGRATRVVERGKEYLRFVDETGQLWIECEPAL